MSSKIVLSFIRYFSAFLKGHSKWKNRGGGRWSPLLFQYFTRDAILQYSIFPFNNTPPSLLLHELLSCVTTHFHTSRFPWQWSIILSNGFEKPFSHKTKRRWSWLRGEMLTRSEGLVGNLSWSISSQSTLCSIIHMPDMHSFYSFILRDVMFRSLLYFGNEKGRKTMARIYLNHPVAGLFYTVWA